MKNNSDETVKVAEAFKQKHQPSNKASVHALISEMETFDKSNFKSKQHAQWQDMFDRVNNSMAICHATVAPLLRLKEVSDSSDSLSRCSFKTLRIISKI